MKTYLIDMFNSLTFVLVLVSCFLYSQNPESYNRIYYKTYLETSQQDLEQAIKTADSLYLGSQTPLYKTKSLMLVATLYQQKGDLEKAIEYAKEAEKIIEPARNYVWEARVQGFLATQYRILNLYEIARDYGIKALAAAKNIEDRAASSTVRGMLYLELAYNEHVSKNYHKSIEYCLIARKYYDHIKADRELLIGDNEYVLGVNYYHLKQYANALQHYHHALKLVENTKHYLLLGKLFSSISKVYIDQNDLKNGKKYLEDAKNITKNSSYLELKKLVNSTERAYYLAVKSFDSLQIANASRDSLNEKIDAKKIDVITKTYRELESEKRQLKRQHQSRSYTLIGIIVILLIVMIGMYMYSRRRAGKGIPYISQLMVLRKNKIKEDGKILSDLPISQPILKVCEMSNQSHGLMPIETEQRILDNLKEFENSDLYLQNVISLSALATSLETNTKYLSYVINVHKKKNFNNYINELRIQYIVEKLTNEPIYRRYKIATIAEEAGFSSANKFAIVFKKVMHETPSAYIRLLKKENASEEGSREVS